MSTPVNLRIMRAIAEGDCLPNAPSIQEYFGPVVGDVVVRIHSLIASGHLTRKVGSEAIAVTTVGKQELREELVKNGYDRPSRFVNENAKPKNNF